MEGLIHSFESFGTVDGPGVRYVVFFQGCPMRCKYCHNPDTWNFAEGMRLEADEVIAKFERNRSFYRTGGITATGGEPLMQIDFLTALFAKAKERGIHTCLDTSGILYDEDKEELMEKFEKLFLVTDLVMLDIKHIEEKAHRELTGQSNRNVIAFAKALERAKIPVWIRHVVVPGITFDEQALTELGRFIKTLSNFEKLEVLPYHTMGKVKYEKLGMEYPLGDTPQLTKEEADYAKELIVAAMER